METERGRCQGRWEAGEYTGGLSQCGHVRRCAQSDIPQWFIRRARSAPAPVRQTAMAKGGIPMKHESFVCIVALIFFSLQPAGGLATDSVPAGPVERTIRAVERCIDAAPGPWPDGWRREYIDAIREAIAADPNAVPGAWHLTALERGFGPYWQAIGKGPDRPSFEVQRAEIRWYVEHLMTVEGPDEGRTRTLREQYGTLWAHAADSLLAQFPFLDPNAVQAARADHQALCDARIDAPLVPLFARGLSEEQIGHVTTRWHDLRYDRVDFWRQLGGKAIITAETDEAAPLQTHPHYLLTQRSLDQWLIHIHAMTIVPPEHYLQALRDRNEAQRRHRQALSQAWADEKRIERQYHGQLLQTEYLSFLFAALLETASEHAVPTQGGDPHGR